VEELADSIFMIEGRTCTLKMELVDFSISWHLSTKVHGVTSRRTLILKPFLVVNVRLFRIPATN